MFIASAINLYSQPFTKYFWRQIPSSVSSNLNNFVYKHVVGDNGTLLITTNSGYSFTKYDSLFINNNLNSIHFILGNAIGTIVGDNGIIFYAITNSWSQQNSGTTLNLNGISGGRYALEYSYWRVAAGDNGTVIRSTNSSGLNWANWYSVTSPTTQNLNSVSMSGNFGCIAGDNGTILKSTNRGVTWSIINTGLTNNLNCVLFTDTLNGWIAGSNGLIMKSTNGGLNWTVKQSGTSANLKSFLPYSAAGSNGTYRISNDMGNT
jgi:photosystem II stability/assembly factor-like uncharacterized protein